MNTATNIPAALHDVALIDGPTAAATASMSISQWREMVAKGDAPAPFVQRSRFTRWRMSDVRAWVQTMPDRLPADPKLTERAKMGSDRAKANRRATSQ